VNETLPRTVMTGSANLAAFGPPHFRRRRHPPFAWVLTFGIVIGTFSRSTSHRPSCWIERKYPRLAADKAHVSASQARAESQADSPRPMRGSKTPAGR
jgi:hypothetical protein